MNELSDNFLRQRGVTESVVKSGIGGVLAAWEQTARELAEGWNVTFTDYLHNLDTRQILEEASDKGLLDEHDLKRLALADRTFAASTREVGSCVLGDAHALKAGYTKDGNWWFWREAADS